VRVYNIKQYKKLTVGFSKSPRLLSKLIRWVEGSEVSHVYIKFHSDFLQRDIIYEASGTVVNFVNLQTFMSRSQIVEEFTYEIPAPLYREAIQFAMDHTGKPYGFLSLIGLGWVKFTNKFGFRTRNPFRKDDKTFICSYLVADLLRGIIKLDSEIPPELLTPTDIYKILLDNPFKRL
jgi:hypothetical protein